MSTEDTRLFRLTYRSGKVKFARRNAVGPAAAYCKHQPGRNYKLGDLQKIEAIPEPDGWEDVTGEFL